MVTLVAAQRKLSLPVSESYQPSQLSVVGGVENEFHNNIFFVSHRLRFAVNPTEYGYFSICILSDLAADRFKLLKPITTDEGAKGVNCVSLRHSTVDFEACLELAFRQLEIF